ncbi:MAG: ABC transporter ATP-binding protein [Bradymonadia bacterium]
MNPQSRRGLGLVRTEGLGRIYDETYALVDVSVAFGPGRIAALLGANGAGKSTLMGMLATVLRPSEGRIVYGEQAESLTGPDLRRHIGYVGHRPMLYAELTARENLRFFASLYGLGAAEADPWLDRVQLGRAADRAVGTFSRGMAQRLALARALLHAPSLVLLDEPFTGLDPAGTDLLLGLLDALRRTETVVVLVTHDLGLSDPVADDVVILRGGRLAFAGPREERLERLYRAHAEARGRAA